MYGVGAEAGNETLAYMVVSDHSRYPRYKIGSLRSGDGGVDRVEGIGGIDRVGFGRIVNLTLSANHPVHPCAPTKSSAHAYTQNCARIRAQQRTTTSNFAQQ